jgi:hypothetical protein
MMENEDKIFEKINRLRSIPRPSISVDRQSLVARREQTRQQSTQKAEPTLEENCRSRLVPTRFYLVLPNFQTQRARTNYPFKKTSRRSAHDTRIRTSGKRHANSIAIAINPGFQNDKTTKAANAQPAVPSANAIIPVADESVVATPAPQSAANEISEPHPDMLKKKPLPKKRKFQTTKVKLTTCSRTAFSMHAASNGNKPRPKEVRHQKNHKSTLLRKVFHWSS